MWTRGIEVKMMGRKFIQGNRDFSDKSLMFSISSQLLLLVGFGVLITSIVFAVIDIFDVAFGLFSVSLTIFFVLSPLLAMIGNVILYRKTRKAKVKVIIVAELAVLLLIGPRCIPYLYASPALTSNRLDAYNAFIDIATDKEDRFESLSLDGFGRLFVEHQYFNITLPDPELAEFFSDSEIKHLSKVSRQLHWAGCYMALREGNWIYFISIDTPYRPLSLGAVYSLNGENPNDFDEIELVKQGPYTLIDGNWYTSTKLNLDGRTGFPLPVPTQSLIDRREVKAN